MQVLVICFTPLRPHFIIRNCQLDSIAPEKLGVVVPLRKQKVQLYTRRLEAVTGALRERLVLRALSVSPDTFPHVFLNEELLHSSRRKIMIYIIKSEIMKMLAV